MGWKGGAHGFTLLEAIVALAILSIAGIAAMQALSAELRTAEHARESLQAVSLAQERLAQIELLPKEELDLLPDSLRRGVFGESFAGYHWQATTREVLDEPDLFDVAVTVEWPDGSYKLASRVHRRARERMR